MKIILLKDEKKLGKKDDIITVKDGYGSYLINQGIAINATKSAVDQLHRRQEVDRLYDAQLISLSKIIKDELEKHSWVIDVPYNKQNQMLTKGITKDMVLKTILKEIPAIPCKVKDFIDFPKTRLAQMYKTRLRVYKDIIADIEFGVEI